MGQTQQSIDIYIQCIYLWNIIGSDPRKKIIHRLLFGETQQLILYKNME